ncbi:E3 ubiquitin-protein ligase BRE1A-like [Anomalospiza imberbis]|uniref:E3 ubiquitin-protein ligase BRE1A-like n=1 Tax=Anomalospiza imberbis TaxID=187417 RepID=UPI00358FA9E3
MDPGHQNMHKIKLNTPPNYRTGRQKQRTERLSSEGRLRDLELFSLEEKRPQGDFIAEFQYFKGDSQEVNSIGYKVYGAGTSSLYGGTITISACKFEEMNAELEENKELAGNRLNKLEELRQDLEEVPTQNEKLKVELRRAVEEAAKETPEYRCMQSQFSVLYNESLQLKAHLDEARTLLRGTCSTHQRQVELMERDEVSLHKKLRTELIQLEDTLAQVRKEYEMLRTEFEQTLAANEQAGPINREMRHLISSLQNHNHQLKGEVLRYKRKLREAQSDLIAPWKGGMEAWIWEDKGEESKEDSWLMAAEKKAKAEEEEALLSEMDVTGQASEDMQEQDIRLMQQLREKDDANFKLMSECIKSNQIHKLLKEGKEELADQVLTLKTQVDAQLQVVRKLEEKEHLLQSSIGTGEKELGLRTQALEMSKRKAMDAAQLADDLKAQLELAQKKLHDFQEEIVENRATREKEMFNLKRAEEDISRLRRKLETTKKADMVPSCDEILMEEIKDYKACLTCPCCNMRKKDAVLTRCFHVFCFECVKTRYDTRQRECPKCNAAFGASDSHRIYIG